MARTVPDLIHARRSGTVLEDNARHTDKSASTKKHSWTGHNARDGTVPVFALVLVREVSLNSGDSPWPGVSHNTGTGNEHSALSRTEHWWRGQSPTLFMRAGRGLSSKITLAILINQRLRKCITGQRIMLGTGLSPVCALVLVREVSLNSGDSPWLGFSHNTGIGNEPSALSRTGHWWRG